MMSQKIVIFKNDAVGDLTQSLPAIDNIIQSNADKKIIIYLSERSKKFYFLINENNHKDIEFRKLNYNLTLIKPSVLFITSIVSNKNVAIISVII